MASSSRRPKPRRKSLNEKHKERDEVEKWLGRDAHNWHEHTYRWTAAISGNQDNPVWDQRPCTRLRMGLRMNALQACHMVTSNSASS